MLLYWTFAEVAVRRLKVDGWRLHESQGLAFCCWGTPDSSKATIYIFSLYRLPRCRLHGSGLWWNGQERSPLLPLLLQWNQKWHSKPHLLNQERLGCLGPARRKSNTQRQSAPSGLVFACQHSLWYVSPCWPRQTRCLNWLAHHQWKVRLLFWLLLSYQLRIKMEHLYHLMVL